MLMYRDIKWLYNVLQKRGDSVSRLLMQACTCLRLLLPPEFPSTGLRHDFPNLKVQKRDFVLHTSSTGGLQWDLTWEGPTIPQMMHTLGGSAYGLEQQVPRASERQQQTLSVLQNPWEILVLMTHASAVLTK